MNKKEIRFDRLQRRNHRLNGRLLRLQQNSQTLSQARLWSFLIGSGVSAAILLQWGATVWGATLLFVYLPFAVLIVIHRRVETAVLRLSHWVAIKQGHLDRMRLTWSALPPAAPIPDEFHHPFALDLNLIGHRSLHQLLDTAVSTEGSERLRAWLLTREPSLVEIERRQAEVAELTAVPHFRDKLTLKGRSLAANEEKWPGKALLDWVRAGGQPEKIRPLLIGLCALSLIFVPLFVLNAQGRIPAWWIAPWGLYAILYTRFGMPQTAPLFRDVIFLDQSLRRLQQVFSLLETWSFADMPHVVRICAPFLDAEKRPSRFLRRVNRVVAGVGIRQNPLLGFLINLIVPWDLFFAYRLNQCQVELGQRLPGWLDAWTELEAASSLATFTWLNPGLVSSPELTDTENGRFIAQGLGHPLISDESRVCNDYQVTQMGSLGLITGSNMAGKSSFLRTVGLNLALAYAGGPVLANRLETSIFRLYTSIQVSDSLQDGFSFFYAEVRRLQALLEAYRDNDKRPLFFLIDEIFRGTNNRERLLGSQAYIKALINGNGTGLIATHDLELARLAEAYPTIQNYHFRDDVHDGKMVFDYLLRPGPCPTTNALKIMQLAGLPVEPNQVTVTEPIESTRENVI